MVYEEFQIEVFHQTRSLRGGDGPFNRLQDLLHHLAARGSLTLNFINLDNVKRVVAQTFELCKFLTLSNEGACSCQWFFE